MLGTFKKCKAAYDLYKYDPWILQDRLYDQRALNSQETLKY